MNRTLKALSILLSYPTEEAKREIDALAAALAEDGLLGDFEMRTLEPLFAEIRASDIYDLEERYVGLFDRSRSLSLNLFEHVHGESRDRGGAMVDLLETYRAAGFEPEGRELPDHLPTLLELLSCRPFDEAQAILADAAHILEALQVRLTRRDSAYAALLGALVRLAATRPDAEAVTALTAEQEEDPDDLEALDRVWEEAAVVFGPDPNAGCPATRDMFARMAPERGGGEPPRARLSGAASR